MSMPKRTVAALLLLSVATAPAWAKVRSDAVEWTLGKDVFRGTLVYDDAGAKSRPGIVMLPNWMGVTADARAMAERIAGKDYVVLVADVYGKDVRPQDDAQALAAVKRAYGDGGRTLRLRAQAAVDALKAQRGKAPIDPARIAAVGFCFGGSVALELARSGSDVAGVVSLHGNLASYAPHDARGVRAPILVLNGADDKDVDAAQITAFEQEMDAARADWQFVDFSGARHCFSQPEDADRPADSNCRYDARAAKRAFEMLHDFLRERFAAE